MQDSIDEKFGGTPKKMASPPKKNWTDPAEKKSAREMEAIGGCPAPHGPRHTSPGVPALLLFSHARQRRNA
jgi:hypothetical protein